MWWTLLGLLFSCGLVAACPEGCSCQHEQGLYSANCSSLPYSGGKVEILTVIPTRDSPLELSEGQFNAARHLKYLNLRNCSVYFIHKKAFYGTKNLVEIDLSFNYIEELDPTVFQHLTSLTKLSLRGNPIHLVPEVPFFISNSLQDLDIGFCKLESIPRETFYGLKRLRYLSMDGNSIKTLKYNSLPKGLKYLNLSKNLIVNVPTEVLSVLTNLRRIGLGQNPINCSCSLMNLQDWLSGRGVVFEDNVTCALPVEYYGVSWSRVDENSLCLDEARRDELFHPVIYNPLFKNRLHRRHYFENENTYLGENLQSDQPQIPHPDSETEVLFQNEETLSLGEMMRDEDLTGLSEKEKHLDSNKNTTFETKDSATNSNTSMYEIHPTVKTQDTNIDVDAENEEVSLIENQNKETILSMSDATHLSQNGSLETDDLNFQDISGTNGETEIGDEAEYLDSVKTNSEGNLNFKGVSNNSSSKTEEKITLKENPENPESEEATTDLDTSYSVNLNEGHPVEYKPLGDDESELDDFKNEGLVHVNENISNTNDSLEESTAIPEIEDTTEYEPVSTQEPLTIDDKTDDSGEATGQNITVSAEVNNSTIQSEEDTVPPPVAVPDLQSTNEPENTSVNQERAQNTSVIAFEPGESTKIKEVAGAEVVVFCIAVLIICLILYSVYKCRTSHKRKSMRVVKDMESNRGTEMQDMASLLPKPQDDQKNNTKYPDKPLPSETMKLINEQNENETQTFIPLVDNKTKVEDKNSLNNNTPSLTNKTPLIKPGNQITINPAAPIQRTKVKVGIIPDSIPRTPIFLQKSYNNGTKNV